jgi:hypothetical protein
MEGVQVKVYIAAAWVRKEDARAARELIQADQSHLVTSRWIDRPDAGEANLAGYYGDQDHRGSDLGRSLAEQSIGDLHDIYEADAFILINGVARESEGKVVETGYALAFDLIPIGVGQPTNVFHYHPNFVWVESVEDAKKVLDGEYHWPNLR